MQIDLGEQYEIDEINEQSAKINDGIIKNFEMNLI